MKLHKTRNDLKSNTKATVTALLNARLAEANATARTICRRRSAWPADGHLLGARDGVQQETTKFIESLK
jgi:hypothetical protein